MVFAKKYRRLSGRLTTPDRPFIAVDRLFVFLIALLASGISDRTSPYSLISKNNAARTHSGTRKSRRP